MGSADANKRHYTKARDAIRAKARAKYAANAAKERARAKAYREANRELVNARAAERSRTPEWQAHQRAWYQANRDRIAAAYAANSGSVRARVKAYRQATPEKQRQYSLKKRLARVGAAASLTIEQWRAILEIFDHRCAYCLKPLTLRSATQDHVVAIARGGQHRAENVVPACRSCNSRKHDLPVFLMARHLRS